MATLKKATGALSQKELDTLFAFIGKCAIEGTKFPSERYGAENVTIMHLASERTVSSLREFGKFINKKLSDSDPDFSSNEPLKFGKVLASELVANLKLLIRYKEFIETQAKMREKVKHLKSQQAELKTPEERRKEIAAELKDLEASLVEE